MAVLADGNTSFPHFRNNMERFAYTWALMHTRINYTIPSTTLQLQYARSRVNGVGLSASIVR